MTKTAVKRMRKRMVERMSGIHLMVSMHDDSFGWGTQHIYREACIHFCNGWIEVYTGMSWDRISVKDIESIKEYEIKRYDITLSNGVEVILSESFI